MRILAYNPHHIELLTGDKNAVIVEDVNLTALLSAAEYLHGNDQLPIMIASKENIDTSLLRRLRDLGFSGAILTGSPQVTAANHIQWRYAGADDVMILPANCEEIRARLSVVERRLHRVSSDRLELGPLHFFLDGRDPEIEGHPITLSPREYNILKQLALNSGRVVAKSTIYDALYALAAEQPFEKIIDVYICRLRSKISKMSKLRLIETIKGRGYRLNIPKE